MQIKFLRKMSAISGSSIKKTNLNAIFENLLFVFVILEANIQVHENICFVLCRQILRYYLVFWRQIKRDMKKLVLYSGDKYKDMKSLFGILDTFRHSDSFPVRSPFHCHLQYHRHCNHHDRQSSSSLLSTSYCHDGRVGK